MFKSVKKLYKAETFFCILSNLSLAKEKDFELLHYKIDEIEYEERLERRREELEYLAERQYEIDYARLKEKRDENS